MRTARETAEIAACRWPSDQTIWNHNNFAGKNRTGSWYGRLPGWHPDDSEGVGTCFYFAAAVAAAAVAKYETTNKCEFFFRMMKVGFVLPVPAISLKHHDGWMSFVRVSIVERHLSQHLLHMVLIVSGWMSMCSSLATNSAVNSPLIRWRQPAPNYGTAPN